MLPKKKDAQSLLNYYLASNKNSYFPLLYRPKRRNFVFQALLGESSGQVSSFTSLPEVKDRNLAACGLKSTALS